jgi:hypothetical protein
MLHLEELRLSIASLPFLSLSEEDKRKRYTISAVLIECTTISIAH